MSIQITIPTPLRGLTQGLDTVPTEATSIDLLIEDLEARYPGMKERLVDADGQIRRFVNIYVNGEDVRFLQEKATSIKAGDEVSIVPAIAGG